FIAEDCYSQDKMALQGRLETAMALFEIGNIWEWQNTLQDFAKLNKPKYYKRSSKDYAEDMFLFYGCSKNALEKVYDEIKAHEVALQGTYVVIVNNVYKQKPITKLEL